MDPRSKKINNPGTCQYAVYVLVGELPSIN